jgi:hypothetical protein
MNARPSERKVLTGAPFLLVRIALTLAAAVLLALLHPADSHAADRAVEFDHFSTGFPLQGAHRGAACSSCHLRGIFKGTPVACAVCHDRASLMGADKKPDNHIPATAMCDDCHTDQYWKPIVRFDHGAVTGSCAGCHDGITATGKSARHITSNNTCDDCHSTRAWVPAAFSHAGIAAGSCFSCHNGSTAPGKTANHIASGNSCDDCHTTSGWTPAVFDHANVTGSCAGCHNGTTATGKHSAHITTSAQCDECHSTIAWTPASFNHDLVTGSCSSCHNGSTATGKPSGHFVTGLQCDECHGTSNWLPIDFRHNSGSYPGDHSGNPSCSACHSSNSQIIPWPSPAYQPDCAGCHASDYRTGEDDHRDLSQDRDCAGSCHQSSPEHSVNSNDW